MHLTFDWGAAFRRSRQSGGPAESDQASRRRSWKRFPYGDRIYRYGGTALKSNWARLHRGDKESYPSAESLEALIDGNPALGPSLPPVSVVVPRLEEAWRAYHAGDFADAVDHGLAAGPVGLVVSARAAAVYAAHLEEDESRRVEILRDVVESCASLVKLGPTGPMPGMYMGWPWGVSARISRWSTRWRGAWAGACGKSSSVPSSWSLPMRMPM